MARIDLKNATIKIQDNAGANSITVKIGDGNLVYTERRTVEYLLDKGLIDEVRLGDKIPVDVRMNFNWDYIKGATGSGVPSPEDAIKKRGEASSWVSTDSDACRPYAVDIVLLNVPACPSGDQETITLEDFRWEELEHDPKAASINVTGKCNIDEATVVREAQP